MAGGNNCHAPYCNFGQGGFCISGLFPTGSGQQQDCTQYGGDPNFSCNCQCCPPCYPCYPCATEFTYEILFTNTNPPGLNCRFTGGSTTFAPKVTTQGCCMLYLCLGCDSNGAYPPQIGDPYGIYSATNCCPRLSTYQGGQAILAIGGGPITISPGGKEIPLCSLVDVDPPCRLRFIVTIRDLGNNLIDTIYAPYDGSDVTFDIDDCNTFELNLEITIGFEDCPCCVVSYPNCGPCKSSKMLCVVQAAMMQMRKKAMLKQSVLSRIKKVHYKP